MPARIEKSGFWVGLTAVFFYPIAAIGTDDDWANGLPAEAKDAEQA